jgi:hypothetical protein
MSKPEIDKLSVFWTNYLCLYVSEVFVKYKKLKSLSVFGFVTSVKHWEDWGGFYSKPKRLLTNKICDFISGLSIFFLSSFMFRY